MRRNFAQILKEAKIDIKSEYQKLYGMLYDRSIQVSNTKRISAYDELSDYFLGFYFRGTCLSIEEFNNVNGFHFEKEPEPFSIDNLILLCEYIENIDAARFVMITAAFEWEFDRLFPDGICKSKERVEAELIVSQKLNELIDTSSGKTKKIYKSLLKCIERRPSLANKIEKIGSDMGALLEPFGQQLYGFNKEELNYTDMGKRLGDQRNYFAHGDLDKDFIGLSLLDLIFLQRIIYAIQLKISGLEDKQIQRAINDLFQCRFAI